MGFIDRRSVSLGWQPDVDAATAPPGAFLRADNLVLDEQGVLALRRDSLRIANYAGLDIHSLQTEFLNGVRCRMVGASDKVLLNGNVLVETMDGDGDIAFGGHQGQILFARGASRFKFDGATLRNWGLAATGDAPTIVPGVPDGKTFVVGTQSGVPAFSLVPSPPNDAWFPEATYPAWDVATVYVAGDIVIDAGVYYLCILGHTNHEPPNVTYWTVHTPSLSYIADHLGIPAGATAIYPNPTTGRGTMTAKFTNPTDFTVYTNGTEGDDGDLISFYAYITEPTNLASIGLLIDVNNGDFQTDYYYINFSTAQTQPVGPTDTTGADFGTAPASPTPVSPASPGDLVSIILNVGWNKLSVTRGQMARIGSTSGTDWTTVKAVRIAIVAYANDLIAVDTVRIAGGRLTGQYEWCYVLAFDTGTYVARSGPSPISEVATMSSSAATVIIPADGHRDTQAGEIWLYRRGGALPNFLRVAVQTIGPASTTPAIFSYTQFWEAAYLGHLTDAVDNGPSNFVAAFEGTDFGSTITPASQFGPGVYTNAFEVSNSGKNEVTIIGMSPTRNTVTGAISVGDTLSDVNALIVNLPLEQDDDTPPENIIDIEAPYFDRTYVLTSDGLLHPSRQLNPDSFASGQAIRICAADETAYWVKKGIGGLYVGTSKDIYRLEGDGTELPDGSINFTKRPLNTDHPPINDGVVQEGNLLVFVANDGWRVFTGETTTAIAGPTSLLYRGYTRHGVSPVNLATGRFRAAVVRGQFFALTPEGDDTTSSTVLYRRTSSGGTWDRRTYTPAFRVIYAERDGTLLAGDADGGVWQLETPNVSTVPIVLWTPVDDLGDPFAVKSAVDLHVTLDSGGRTCTVMAVRDGDADSGISFNLSSNGLGLRVVDASGLRELRQLQLQLTGNFTTFRYAGYGLTVVPRPTGVLRWDTGPIDIAQGEMAWVRRLFVKVRPSGPVTASVIIDGATKAVQTVAAGADQDLQVPIDFGRGVVGRQVRLVLTSPNLFIPYSAQIQLRSTGKGSQKPIITVNAA